MLMKISSQFDPLRVGVNFLPSIEKKGKMIWMKPVHSEYTPFAESLGKLASLVTIAPVVSR